MKDNENKKTKNYDHLIGKMVVVNPTFTGKERTTFHIYLPKEKRFVDQYQDNTDRCFVSHVYGDVLGIVSDVKPVYLLLPQDSDMYNGWTKKDGTDLAALVFTSQDCFVLLWASKLSLCPEP